MMLAWLKNLVLVASVSQSLPKVRVGFAQPPPSLAMSACGFIVWFRVCCFVFLCVWCSCRVLLLVLLLMLSPMIVIVIVDR